MAKKISAVIIAKNEETRIRRCLESLRWTDEIVVVDGGSADRTVEICRAYTDRVTERPFRDFSDQKNHALSLASGDWVLSIDADEEVTAELADEIRRAVEGGSDAYRIRRRSFMFGRAMRFTGTQNDRPIRLFRKGCAVFEQPVHETVRVQGRVGLLAAALNHYTYATVSEYMEKFNRYTSMEALLMEQTGAPTGGGLSWKPWAMFFRLYFLCQGFRDGMSGFLFSALSGYYVFAKHAKRSQVRA